MAERDDFGPGLRRERERRAMTLDAISARTKVSASLYAALERNDLSKWPAGIFRRAFVRGYAEAIGLEPERLVAEFVRLFPEEPDGARPVKPPAPTHRFTAADRGTDEDLRLTLAEDRPLLASSLLERVPRAVRAALIDLGVVAALSAAATAVAGVSAFWICLGVAALAYQFTAMIFFHSSLGARLAGGVERDARLTASVASVSSVSSVSSVTGAASPPRAREASNVVSHPSSRKLARRRMRLGA